MTEARKERLREFDDFKGELVAFLKGADADVPAIVSVFTDFIAFYLAKNKLDDEDLRVYFSHLKGMISEYSKTISSSES